MKAENGVNIDAQVYPIKEPRNNTLAMASLTIGDCFAVRGLKVINGKNGPFVSMPQAKDGQGEYHDLCFPVTKELRESISQLVLEKYNAELDKGVQGKAPQQNQQTTARSNQQYNNAPARQPSPQQSGTPRNNGNSYRGGR